MDYISEYNLNTKPLEMDLLIVKKEKEVEIKLDEITISLVKEKKPEKLFHWFERNGYQIQETYRGIYYVTKDNHFITQIIVSKQLSKENQKWLTLLNRNLNKEDAKRTVKQIETLAEESEKQHGDSVLQVAMQENEETFNKIKEEGNMCEALRKLMEPEMNEALNEALNKATKRAEESQAKSFLESIANLQKNLQLSLEDALKAIGKTVADYEKAKMLVK